MTGILTYEYVTRIEFPSKEWRLDVHSAVTDGTAENPYRYRILAPYLADQTMKLIAPLFPSQPQKLRSKGTGKYQAFFLTYAVFDFLTLFSGLYLLHVFLTCFFTQEQSLIGVLMSALNYQMTIRDHHFHPWSLLELPLFTAGLLSILHRRDGWFVAIVLVSSFNRETSCFLLLAFLFTRVFGWAGGRLFHNRKELPVFAAASLAFLAVFTGLRFFLGYPAPVFTIERAWTNNLHPWRLTRSIVLNSLFWGLLWIWMARGLRTAPAFLRAVAPIIPFYVALLLAIGYWNEIRYWIMLYPVTTGLVLAGLYGDRRRTALARAR